MRPLILSALGLILFAQSVAIAQQSYSEPERGTQLRADLMDAVRPIAEWNLGAPVEFVVNDLRVLGNVAFAVLSPQRPGGGKIVLGQSPFVQIFGNSADELDGATMQVLLQKSGRMWVPVQYGIGSSDAWWDWDVYCRTFRRVIPEVCQFD